MGKKVQVEERKFLIDQRTTKKLFIGTVDRAASVKKAKSAARKLSDLNRLRPLKLMPSTTKKSIIDKKRTDICYADSDTDSCFTNL